MTKKIDTKGPEQAAQAEAPQAVEAAQAEAPKAPIEVLSPGPTAAELAQILASKPAAPAEPVQLPLFHDELEVARLMKAKRAEVQVSNVPNAKPFLRVDH